MKNGKSNFGVSFIETNFAETNFQNAKTLI